MLGTGEMANVWSAQAKVALFVSSQAWYEFLDFAVLLP